MAPGSVDAWPASFWLQHLSHLLRAWANTTFDRVYSKHLEFRPFGRKLWGAQVQTKVWPSGTKALRILPLRWSPHLSARWPSSVASFSATSCGPKRARVVKLCRVSSQSQSLKPPNSKVINLRGHQGTIIKEVASCSFNLLQTNIFGTSNIIWHHFHEGFRNVR